MINRELIRIKAVQLVYANLVNGGKDLDKVIKEMDESLAQAYYLYHHMLNLMCEVTDYADHQYEITCQQMLERNRHAKLPSDRFVRNRFASQLEGNSKLEAFTLKHKELQWTDHEDVVHEIYNKIVTSPEYEAYMASDDDSYEADRELWRKLYRTLIQNNESLDALLEEKSLYWNDDKDVVDTFVLKTIKRFEEKNLSNQELLPEYDNMEDKEYARKLFRAAIMNAEEYQHYMSETSRNWDFSRLAYMDIVIMQIAIAEILTFPSIPINVSINEYVEIAKLYSTPRSAGYINGMLDAIARHLSATGKLLKHIENK